jgi:cbb3-type cytochrome oxidase maturation protein
MESIYLLIPISVLLVFGIAIAFWWSVRSGQFDDLEGPGFRVLMDDDDAPPAAKNNPPEKK